MEYVAQLQELERRFVGTDLEKVMLSHAEIPVFVVTAYLAIVFYVPQLMQRRNALGLKSFFMLWNLLLAVFSIVGAYKTIPHFLHILSTKGWHFSVCQDPAEGFYHNGAVGLWVGFFVLSKIPELMDTVFLVVQKKPVIFLHWYHHCTVMLYCWHAYSTRIGAGLWFAAMNYGVHSIMYSYYFLMCFEWGKKLVRPFAVYITSLQIVQMVLGMAVSVYAFLSFNPAIGQRFAGSCYVDAANMKMALMMYSSYFVLFGYLFKKLYIDKSKSKGTLKGKDGAADIATDICQATQSSGKVSHGKQE